MKLRNKKTGEIEPYVELIINQSFGRTKEYSTLKEFCEEWEDYKPDEPLIKDEKIRKAIKAWGYSPLTFKQHRRKGYCKFWYLDKYICFNGKFEGLKDMKHYTITELCGEEE